MIDGREPAVRAAGPSRTFVRPSSRTVGVGVVTEIIQ